MSVTQTPEAAEEQLPIFRFILFVAGDERNSRIAKNNLARICKDILVGRCEVELVDVMQDFAAALKYNILLTPSLLVVAPPPQVMIVGNLDDMEEVSAALQISN
jgi:circadian clock protein KaiB